MQLQTYNANAKREGLKSKREKKWGFIIYSTIQEKKVYISY